MKYPLIAIALTLLVIAPYPAWTADEAIDINGDWTAEIPNQDGKKFKAFYEFKVDGTTLTGSAINPSREEERPILNGKIKGDKLSFTLKESSGNYTATYLYEGKVSGNTIRFRVVRANTKSWPWEFTAIKVQQ